ncbi:MAG: DEAD/DEAH box helicase [Firmicutes bacterium]|nr:DEAD/DEAH box helicase [Bacillota bacterium]
MNHESRAAMKARIRELEHAYQGVLQENGTLRRELEQLKQPLPHPHGGSTAGKIQLFRSLFRSRDDVYAVRWANAQTGKSGYAPALRTRGKRPPYDPKDLLPLTDAVIYDHLKGHQTVGLYPLLPTEETWFLTIDFDKSDWHQDALAYLNVCRKWGVPAAMERSRSGNGAHVWIFFEVPVSARLARRLGTRILTEASHNMGRPRLESYDRFFPNQDTMPAGGFGNLIALPLQGAAVKSGNTQFIQDDGTPWPDQWDYLRALPRMVVSQLTDLVANMATEWEALGLANHLHAASPEHPAVLDAGTCPTELQITVKSRVDVPTAALSRSFVYELVRLAAFPNPEFYRRQRMHFSTWNTPRVLSLADDLGESLALPRSLLDDAIRVLTQHRIRPMVHDQTMHGKPISVHFTAQLHPEQLLAVQALVPHESGVLDAATGFGKTLVAAYLIAQRQVNTLVLVPNLQLLGQWREHLAWALTFDQPDAIGQWSGSKKKATGIVDIATLQTLSRRDGASLLEDYGFLIVDECHHLASPSFETILRNSPSRYRLGLSATPLRRDGHHPIIFMHLGPIRFTYDTKTAVHHSPYEHRVQPRITPFAVEDAVSSLPIQEIYRRLSDDPARNKLIADDVQRVVAEGRHPLVLTQRTRHRDHLAELLRNGGIDVIILTSQPNAKRRERLQAQLSAPTPTGGQVILATGRLVGEGFDLPRLDTLVLAAPVSWRSVLQQYVGRLHRRHPDKQAVIVYDYVDAGVPQLARMYQRRVTSYRSFGYHIEKP